MPHQIYHTTQQKKPLRPAREGEADAYHNANRYSINDMLRWINSVRFLPLSMPFDKSARSIIWRTLLFTLPISSRRASRSVRSSTMRLDNVSRISRSSAVSSSLYLPFTVSSKRLSSCSAAVIFLPMVRSLSPYSCSTSPRISKTMG